MSAFKFLNEDRLGLNFYISKEHRFPFRTNLKFCFNWIISKVTIHNMKCILFTDRNVYKSINLILKNSRISMVWVNDNQLSKQLWCGTSYMWPHYHAKLSFITDSVCADRAIIPWSVFRANWLIWNQNQVGFSCSWELSRVLRRNWFTRSLRPGFFDSGRKLGELSSKL